MKILVVLILAVFTGCNANVMWINQPRGQVDMVKNAFSDYVAKATKTAEETLEQIRRSELGQEVNTLIATSTDTINRLGENLRSQVASLSQDIVSKFSKEAEQLKLHLETDLGAMRTSLQPYSKQLVADFHSKMEALKKDVAPYVETMDPEALRPVLLQKSQELKAQLEKNMKQLQAQMGPYAKEMKEKMEQSMQEFQRSFGTQMTERTQQIQESLALYAEEIRAKLDVDIQNMKEQLTALWKSFTKLSQ
ncbi:uncharacterized protein KZ484_007179 [Pholidichthys leucotaenia]